MEHYIPLTELLKKEQFGQWKGPQEKAFQELKKVLTSGLVLRIADPDLTYYVHTDASGYCYEKTCTHHGNGTVKTRSRDASGISSFITRAVL